MATRALNKYRVFTMPFDVIVNALKVKFADITTSEFRDNRRVVVKPANLFDVLKSLKDEHGFDMLAELTAVDYLKYPNATDRFGVVYCLLNTTTGERVIVKTFLNQPDLTI